MIKNVFRLCVLWLLCLFLAAPLAAQDGELPVRVVKTDEARIDVFVGDELFTAYYYGLGLHKPIFHPLKTPRGQILTRRYPMELGVPGEARDHWHHEGMWFTYGDVNGVDFWAKFPTSRQREGSGIIRHTGFGRLEGGSTGRLEATADWVTPSGQVLLKQSMEALFRGSRDSRVIDLTIRLTAQDEKVVFGDTKEGMFGIRVTTDMQENRTGAYLNAEGKEKEAGVWGKRSPWMALRGKVGDEDLTLAIFDHPESVAHPTYWHARGYGLFAVNPFGRQDFEEGSEAMNFTLQPGQSTQFRYRVLIHSGQLGAADLKHWAH